MSILLKVAFENNPFLVGVPDDDVTEMPARWTVSDREYHADRRCESSSTIGKLLKSPWKYYTERVLGREEESYSPSRSIGTALHHKILTPDLFGTEVRTLPRYAKSRAAIEARAADPYYCWLEPGAIERVFRMESILHAARDSAAFDGSAAEPVYAALLGDAESETEVAFRMRHPESGVAVKCKCDMLVHAGDDELWQIDLKTSRHPLSPSFLGSFREYGYHRQAALYHYILRHAYPAVNRIRVFYVAVSNRDKPESQVYQVSNEVLAAGWAEASEALSFLAEMIFLDSEHEWANASPREFSRSFFDCPVSSL